MSNIVTATVVSSFLSSNCVLSVYIFFYLPFNFLDQLCLTSKFSTKIFCFCRKKENNVGNCKAHIRSQQSRALLPRKKQVVFTQPMVFPVVKPRFKSPPWLFKKTTFDVVFLSSFIIKNNEWVVPEPIFVSIYFYVKSSNCQ